METKATRHILKLLTKVRKAGLYCTPGFRTKAVDAEPRKIFELLGTRLDATNVSNLYRRGVLGFSHTVAIRTLFVVPDINKNANVKTANSRCETCGKQINFSWPSIAVLEGKARQGSRLDSTTTTTVKSL